MKRILISLVFLLPLTFALVPSFSQEKAPASIKIPSDKLAQLQSLRQNAIEASNAYQRLSKLVGKDGQDQSAVQLLRCDAQSTITQWQLAIMVLKYEMSVPKEYELDDQAWEFRATKQPEKK